MLHSNPWWTITIPDDWEVDQDEHCTTFYHPEGVGALQVSAAKKDSGSVTTDDLYDAAKEHLSVDVSTSTWSGWFSGISAEFVRENNFWRQWWLAAGNTLVYVTYICATTDRGREEQTAAEAVATLRPRTTGV